MSRKNRNQEKKLRRELEILRAELRSRNNGDQEVVQSPNITDLTNSIPSQSSNKKNSFNFDLFCLFINISELSEYKKVDVC